ncbi:hypothetical protein FRB99_002195 [Tulasnella sp. 403]|nr:hypothetical protein FRB99_002195 [Tulasnella sp. 403]
MLALRGPACRLRPICRSSPYLYRNFSIHRPRLQQTAPPNQTKEPPPKPIRDATGVEIEPPFYHGPLTRTFQSLKVFSLSSLGLCTSVSPFIYLIDAELAMSARTGLVVFAVTTSSLSTALVGWLSSPYVILMSRLNPPRNPSASTPVVAPGAVELLTRDVILRERRTRVYDPIFLGPTGRKFAKWELLNRVVVDTSADDVPNPNRRVGGTEIVAETRDKAGNVLGKWVVRWDRQEGAPDNVLVGVAGRVGNVVRYFNVHEELL